MLLKSSLVLLFAWLVGVLGLFSIGGLVHVLLLVGLMLGLLGALKAREAAITAARHGDQPSSMPESKESRVSGKSVR
jgi:hypothetical protein